MANASSARKLDDELEVQRMWEEEPADDDANAAATKVGPMSRAFVDQIMFKAQLAESGAPPSDSEMPAPMSGTRRRGISSNAPPMASREVFAADLPVLNADEDDHATSQATVVAASAHAELVSMEAHDARVRSQPPAKLQTESETKPEPEAEQPEAKAPPAKPAVFQTSAFHAPVSQTPVSHTYALQAPVFQYVQAPFDGTAGGIVDRRLALQMAVVLGTLGTAVAAVLFFLFP